MAKKVGDIIFLVATGDFAPGIECVVEEVDNEGRILKAKSLVRDERLAKLGFILEGEDYIVVQWNWSEN